MLWSPPGYPLKGKSVALHRSAGAMISKEIYIKRKNVRTKRGEENETIDLYDVKT